jgi:cytochrome P450
VVSNERGVPPHVPHDLVHDFDHVTGPDVDRDPFAVYRNAPAERAFFSPMHGGYWVLTKAEDIRAALQQPELFSSASTGIPAQPARKEKLFPLELDPPEHRPYRQVLAPFFAPKVVTAKAAVIGEVCTGLLDGLVPRGECEFVADFAQPFPTTIFTAMLGLPDSESKQFVEWNSVLLHGYDDPGRRGRDQRIPAQPDRRAGERPPRRSGVQLARDHNRGPPGHQG